jgi:hypothetical protein
MTLFSGRFKIYICIFLYPIWYSGGKIIKSRPDDCFYHTLCVETITSKSKAKAIFFKRKFYLRISTALLCVIIKDVYTVYVTSIPIVVCIEQYLFDDNLTFYKNHHKVDVKLSMREKQKSYFWINVKNKAPWDT